ncbi:MAG: glycosyltransferase [Planctomycetes bacterium]|nr:glycosyltransferase [Planctomycetota bacterium]
MEKATSIAVIIPCYNEANAIYHVVKEFQSALPESDIHVFDNASTDDTSSQAEKAGAIIHLVSKKGKGNVVRAMFRDVEADYYIMVDGDGTYPATHAQHMLETIANTRADMVVGTRLVGYLQSNSRAGHLLGNNIITTSVNYLFNSEYLDLLSGYRLLSKRFVKTIPLFSEGFEVETTISIHAIEVDAKVIEVPIEYRPRAEGTESKLSTFKDGLRIGLTILSLLKNHRPKLVYGIAALFLAISALFIGVPIIIEYFMTGLVPRFPSAILASGLMILAFLSMFTGILVSTISKNHRELKKLAFLSLK